MVEDTPQDEDLAHSEVARWDTGPPVAHPRPDWDLGRLLEEWKFEPGELSARCFVGHDGRQKIQMRLELGILQMEADGRPDGQRPGGVESLFEYHQEALRTAGPGATYRLTPDECLDLRHEALLYYHRYLCCFCIGDFERMERDTARNLAVFDFVRDHAEAAYDRESMEPYRPYVLMMQARARAGMALRCGRYAQALSAVEQGIAAIQALGVSQLGQSEPMGADEIEALQDLADEIRRSRPPTRLARLEAELQAAVECEDYMAAARLRDLIRMERSSSEAPPSGR
ncbi:MAG TPA: UvrB/UvrC motif-containing protein [Armatimonadota bacterium]|nr:UvrB/UvrC motif-containing protein [Armatimonadota bacterium]